MAAIRALGPLLGSGADGPVARTMCASTMRIIPSSPGTWARSSRGRVLQAGSSASGVSRQRRRL